MRKGFTLIELLAVIVILAIIALIAVPIVINIINDAKEESLKRSVQSYLDGVTSTITKENLKTKYNPDECIIQNNGDLICSENGNELTTSNGTNKLVIDIKGKKPSSGIIKMKSGKIIDIIDIYLNNKFYVYDLKGNIISSVIPSLPGLYDEDNKILATWDELITIYNLNISKDYNPSEIYSDSGSLYYILNNNENLKKSRTLIISKEVTRIGNFAFRGCWKITNIIFEKNSNLLSIGEFAFQWCGIKSIIIPKNVMNIDKYIFCGDDIEKINVEKGNIFYEDRGSNSIIERSTNTLIAGCKNTVIPNGVKSIGESAFYNNDKIKQITIPSSVTSIGTMAFADSSELTSVIFKPNSQLETLGDYAFASCNRLKNISIPDTVTTIGNYTFSWCNSLTNIVIPSGVTRIEPQTFQSCTNLTSVTFENKTGWFTTSTWNATSGDSIDVTNPTTNAINLKDTYKNKYWKRNP